MSVINLGLVLLIVLFAVANLIIEINDNIKKHFEWLYRLLFGGIAVGALMCVLYNRIEWFYSLSVLVLLILRYRDKKEHINE